MTSFRDLRAAYPFAPIRGCPGRYVHVGGGSAALEEFVRHAPAARAHKLPSVRDLVWIVPVEGGGLISYERKDGIMIHTLGDAEGFSRKLSALGL